MNDKMLEIIGLADEKYLREAEAQPADLHRRRKFSAGFIAAAAAAAVMTVTAGAVTVASLIHKDSVEFYYNEEMASEIEERGFAVGQVTENDHVRLTLENLMVDENYAYGVITAEPLDEIGNAIFNTQSQVPEIIMLDDEGNNLEQINQNVTPMLGITYNYGKDHTEGIPYIMKIHLGEPFSEGKLLLPDEVNIVFTEKIDSGLPSSALDGLKLRVSTKPNTLSYHLVSENGYKAVISGFMMDFTYTEGEYETISEFAPKYMTLRFNNKSEQVLQSTDDVNQCDFYPEVICNPDENGKCEYRGSFYRMIDLEGLTEIEFAGITYKVI